MAFYKLSVDAFITNCNITSEYQVVLEEKTRTAVGGVSVIGDVMLKA